MSRPNTHRPHSPRRLAWIGVLAVGVWLGAATGHAADARDPEADLKQIRERIDAARKRIQADTVRRDALAGELQAADIGIQTAREQAADLRKQRQAAERK